MRSKVTLPWNAAAWRQSTYEPRVRKVHDPVSSSPGFGGETYTTNACRVCGHHVCSCERQACYTLSGISYTKPLDIHKL